MIKILFIILIVYAIYKLVKGGYIAIAIPSAATTATPTPTASESIAARALTFLRSVF